MGSDRATDQEVLDATAATEAAMRPQAVPINMYETRAALVIVAPMVAVTADDVTVELQPGTLRFWAHLRSAGPREYLIHEWHFGGYERQVEIPEGFGRSVEASLGNGQLAIRVLRGDPLESMSVKPTAL
ncbi:MAG: Hsp20/alpha crystallin family protein [Actinomycetota bacterium]|nr:Hsp20/alpha crystallin family protein [Actinomycetota bacterium]